MNQDDIAEGGQSPAPQEQEVEKPESKQAAASEADEMRERLLRALADAENARKRADRARAEGRESGIADLVSKIVPALDSLDLAIEAAGRTEEGTQPSVDALLNGLRATSRAFPSVRSRPTTASALLSRRQLFRIRQSGSMLSTGSTPSILPIHQPVGTFRSYGSSSITTRD